MCAVVKRWCCETCEGPDGMTQPPSITTSELILPDQANHYGTLFGGHALRLLASAAFAAAYATAGGAVVMAAVERGGFASPVPVGSLLGLAAHVLEIRHSSMTITVTGTLGAEHVLTARFVMVAVDAEGRPRHIPSPSKKEAQS